METFSTAVVEIHDDEDQVTHHLAREVSFPLNTVAWTDAYAPEEVATKTYPYTEITDRGLYVEAVLADGFILRVRPLDPYDGVRWSPAGVPQPLAVLQAEAMQGGGVMAQELTAVVAADNTVVTLLLETGVGLYVRFSGDWQRLSASSTALEDTSLLKVSPGAVDIFDAADMANATLSAFDLPRTETIEGVEFEINPEAPEEDPLASGEGPVIASGTTILQIRTVDDLDTAIRHARFNRGARWYVERRAAALGATERIPMDWRS